MENKNYLGLIDIDSMLFFAKESKTSKQIINCDKIEIDTRQLETTYSGVLETIKKHYKEV